MKNIHGIYRNRKTFLRKTTCSMVFLMCFISFCLPSFTAYSAPIENNNVVRVGFFEFEGYHETDAQNRRSGYGYEYLHEMAKYTGWIFEYVDGTWGECQEMLKNGKIDILTSAQYSEERDKLFDFSSSSMGTSYAQLTVADGNSDYDRNDFEGFDNIRVGLLKGNSRNDRLAEFAAEKGFSYTSATYNTQDELDSALRTGSVDAVLTSSLRKLNNERIIAQFAPAPFYAIVKEGNEKLLNEVNLALESIEMNAPAFQNNLYQEYYRASTTDTFVLSREEKEYLESEPILRVVIRPGVAPVSYWEDDEFKGISADVMDYLIGDLGIQVEYLHPEALKESYGMLANGTADIACLFESDYNLAEQYKTRITAPYLKTNYSIISRRQSRQPVQTVAVPDGELIGARYAQAHYANAAILPVSSSNEAIEAVSKGKADVALINVYSAEKALVNFNNLRARFISDDNQQFSVGVSQSTDARLYSILDKKINAMSSQAFNDILSKHTMFDQSAMTLADYFRQHPMQIILASVIVFLVTIAILVYIMLMNKKHADSMYRLAYVDNKTKLWNTNGFLSQGNSLLAKNVEDTFAVIGIDLSKFSAVNENYGRNTGDKVIQYMGNILNRFSNSQTVIAHSDADHFLMLLSYKNQSDLHATLTAISGMLTSYSADDLSLHFNVYVGVSRVEKREDSLLKAIDHAHIARNKCDAEHTIVYMDDALQNSLLREKEILEHVEDALELGEFQVYYQPKFDMESRGIIGAEALIRWNHSKLGFLSPAEFIPVLEQSGIITEVDFFVLEQTCKMVKNWIDVGQAPIVVSVNQSRAHFVKKDYMERLQNMIVEYNIPPGHIELEITETLFGQETISNDIIKKMRTLGLLISIDDFGSGYSSLYLLHQISVDILKIDKGLLDEGGRHEKVRNIIRRIVQIAADLDIDVICEGVETEEQVKFLLGIDCKYAQGFLFSKPLPQPDFEMFVRNNKVGK